MNQYFERLKRECLTLGRWRAWFYFSLVMRSRAQGPAGSCCAVLFFVLHPLTDKIGAGDNAEIVTLAAQEIGQRDSI